MPTPTDRLNEDDPQLLRPPDKSRHAPSTLKHRVPSNTFKKVCDDNAVVARASPRVSSVCEGG
jgi:hypothetical protein